MHLNLLLLLHCVGDSEYSQGLQPLLWLGKEVTDDDLENFGRFIRVCLLYLQHLLQVHAKNLCGTILDDVIHLWTIR